LSQQVLLHTSGTEHTFGIQTYYTLTVYAEPLDSTVLTSAFSSMEHKV